MCSYDKTTGSKPKQFLNFTHSVIKNTLNSPTDVFTDGFYIYTVLQKGLGISDQMIWSLYFMV